MLNERGRQFLIQKLQAYLEPDQISLLQRTDLRYHTIAKISALKIIQDCVLYALVAEIIGYPYKHLEKEKISSLYSNEFYNKYHIILLENNILIMEDPLDIAVKNMIPSVSEIYLGSWSNMQNLLMNKTDEPDLLHDILKNAVLQKASDIHFQVEEKTIVVRFRLQSILRKHQTLAWHEWNKMIVKLKVRSQLDISESRRPQSGQFSLFDHVDFRISTHPTIYGENVVIRVLEKNKEVHDLDNLGFEPFQVEVMRHMIQKNFGLILICGPTGSGKTTTLYSLFQEMNDGKKNIMTLEEPVEYRVSGIAQSEIIHEEIMGYADGIKSMMRQDPDVIFIGEIRDENTAKMAFRAAMTGHLVIATLHTFNITSSMYRLLDLGISKEFFKVALRGILAQRLIRLICENCQGKGCETCYFEGLCKRQAIGEVVEYVDDGIPDIVTMQDIFRLKVQEGKTLEKELKIECFLKKTQKQ